jgi:hypothetical protein
MKDEYDLSKMKSRPNRYVGELQKEISIHTDTNVIEYFKTIAQKSNKSYQELISSYLKECMLSKRDLGYL